MTAPPDTALLTSTSESLAPIIPILDGFAHRHKNQHSSTHWWSSFSLFRRAVRNLALDLTSRPKKTKSSNNAKRDSHPALVRAKWMMRHVVPDAFVTFSQLAADNQHAPLGLLLLSVLARTNTLLSQLVPSENDHESLPAAATKPISSALEARGSLKPTAQSIEADIETDMGVAISREELLSSKKTTKSISESDLPTKDVKLKERKIKTVHADVPKRSSKDDAKDKPKKKKKKGGDALSSLFGSL